MKLEDYYTNYIFSLYPELAHEKAKVITTGSQNLVVILGGRLVFRFPLNAESSSPLPEQWLLPLLNGKLTLPTPKILYASDPDGPVPFIGYSMIPGHSLDIERMSALSPARQEAAAMKIARFLAELHTFDHESMQWDLPDVTQFQLDWRKYWGGYYLFLEQLLFPHIPAEGQMWINALFHEYLYPDNHFQFRPCLIHGDFKSDHIMVDKKGRIRGVIDFGMAAMGDPAYDFPNLMFAYGEPFAWKVFEAYEAYGGPTDPTFYSRCRLFYCQKIGISMLVNAISHPDPREFEIWTNWLLNKAEQGELY